MDYFVFLWERLVARWNGMLATDSTWGETRPPEFMKVLRVVDENESNGLVRVSFKVRPSVDRTAFPADLVCYVKPGERDLALSLPCFDWDLRLNVCAGPDTKLSDYIKWRVIVSTLTFFDAAELLVEMEDDGDFLPL